MWSFLAHLRERKLAHWAIAYLAAAWLLLQVVGLLAQPFAWPDLVLRAATVLLGIGFLAVLVLAWYHGERGAQRVSGVELLMLAGILVIAAAAVSIVSQRATGGAKSPAPTAPPGSAVDDRSIAVLPFVNPSSDPEQEYFSDGLTEELLNVLAQLPELHVPARTSAFSFKGRNVPVDSIGRILHVAHVVEGSVRKAGARVRITAQLIDAQSGYHQWSQVYDRQLTDILAIQEEIARAIANAMKVTLGVEGMAAVAREKQDVEAYNLYLQARYFWNRRRGEDLVRARDLLQQALAREPGFARAYAALADVYLVLPEYQGALPAESYELASAAAQKALELDSTLAEPYAALGVVYERRYEWEEARNAYRTALRLKPDYETAHKWYAQYLAFTGDAESALAEIERAERADPLSRLINLNHGEILGFLRRYDEAIAQYAHTQTLDPTYAPAFLEQARFYVLKQDPASALATIARAPAALERLGDYDLGELAYVYAATGRTREATRLIDTLESRGRWALIVPPLIALGETGRALSGWEKAFSTNDPMLGQFALADQRVAAIRNYPRFQAVLSRMNLVPAPERR